MKHVAVLNVGSGQYQLRTIRFYGRLGQKYGRVHRMCVRNAAEVIRAFAAQFPDFDAYLTQSRDRNVGYAVFYGKENLAKEQLHDPAGNEDIRIAPMIMGAKNGGITRIIEGIVIIVVSMFLDYWTGGTFSELTGGSTYEMGLAMIIGGVIQLLTPTPKGRSAKDRPENMPNYSFNGPINTQAQGNPFQVLYGELIIGSAVASAGILAVDAYAPTGGTSTTPSTTTGGGGVGGGTTELWAMSL